MKSVSRRITSCFRSVVDDGRRRGRGSSTCPRSEGRAMTWAHGARADRHGACRVHLGPCRPFWRKPSVSYEKRFCDLKLRARRHAHLHRGRAVVDRSSPSKRQRLQGRLTAIDTCPSAALREAGIPRQD